jgi:uncharacterized protein GlcG (DUF336 family)
MEELMKISNWMLIAGTLVALPCSGAQTLVTERTLSVDAALEAAKVALDFCRKEGHTVTVTVLDHAARTKVVLREDGANPHTIQNSMNKAYTALTYRMPSSEFGKRNAANFPASAGALFLDKVTTAAGGLPIFAGKDIVGSIGISGTPGAAGGGAADAKCAQAGIDGIAKGLK